MSNDNIPKFFEDNSENLDHEIMLDYFLAWTLRCAQKNNTAIEVKNASHKILSYLLFNKQEEFVVKEVRTWKQWNQIDLCAEVEITRADNDEQYALLFENKMYTHVHDNQLKRYKKIFEDFYGNEKNKKTDYIRKYIFLTCLYKESDYESDFKECENLNYTPYSFSWLKSNSGISETGNYLFDEFWFKYWK